MTRLHQLICYFVDHLPGRGRTQIVKYLYLADYESRRHLGKPISSLSYLWDQYGPFDAAILSALDEMAQQGIIRQESVSFPNGTAGYRYYITSAPGIAGSEFTTAEQAILKTIMDNYGSTPLQELLEEVVYKTEPMLDATDRNAYKRPLRMELVDNKERIPGLELEEVLQADDDLRSGKGIPLSDVLAKKVE